MSYDSYSNRTASWGEMAPSANRAKRGKGRAAIADDLEDLSPLDDDEDDIARPSRWQRMFGGLRPQNLLRHRNGRITLGVIAVIALSAAGFAYYKAHSFLLHNAQFSLGSTEDITATGNAQVTRADLLPVFVGDVNHNLLLIPLADRRKQIEQIPWVKQATVMRVLPNHLKVSITERTPIAFVREGDKIELADADGVLLTMNPAMMAEKHYSFPVITGIRADYAPDERAKRMAVYQRFLSALDAGSQHLSSQISEIDLTNPDDVRVTMPEQNADITAHFGQDHFLERYQSYKAHIAEWRQQYPKLTGVDLRYDQQVVLKMASNATPNDATTTAAAKKADAAPKPVIKRAAKPAPKHKAAKPAKPAPAKHKPARRQTA